MGMDQDDVVFIPITTAQKKVMGIRFPDQVKFVMLQVLMLRVLTAHRMKSVSFCASGIILVRIKMMIL